MKKIIILLGAFAALVAAAAPPPTWQTSPRASVMINGGAMMDGSRFCDAVLPVIKKHFAGCKRIALLLWASHPDDYERTERRLQTAFAGLGEGITATSLHHFDDRGARRFLAEADGIFAGGGETFALLAKLHGTGQLDLIRGRVVNDGVPYLGDGAGADIAGLVVGASNDFLICEIPSRAALGLLPVTINSQHPGTDEKNEFSGRAGKIHSYLRFNPNETVLGLGNASMIRLHDSVCVVETGAVWIYDAGRSIECTPGDTIDFPGAKPIAYVPPQPVAQAPSEVPTPEDAKSIWERLGLAKDKSEPGWRDIPPMEARVLDWVSINAFKLDNGQVWEGAESIPYELKGKNVTISARPMGAFELSIEGKSTTIRVRRLK